VNNLILLTSQWELRGNRRHFSAYPLSRLRGGIIVPARVNSGLRGGSR